MPGLLHAGARPPASTGTCSRRSRTPARTGTDALAAARAAPRESSPGPSAPALARRLSTVAHGCPRLPTLVVAPSRCHLVRCPRSSRDAAPESTHGHDCSGGLVPGTRLIRLVIAWLALLPAVVLAQE